MDLCISVIEEGLDEFLFSGKREGQKASHNRQVKIKRPVTEAEVRSL